MNTILKNKIVGFFSLGMVLAGMVSFGVFMQSCSNDDDFMDTSIGSYTELEKAQIMKLAEQYGLDIVLNEEFNGKKQSMKEIEEMFQAFASAKGEYEFIKVGDNEVVSRKKLSGPRLKNSSETGSWSDTKNKNDSYGWIEVTVKISWDFTYSYLSSNSVSMSGDIVYYGNSLTTTTDNKSSSFTVSGAGPTICFYCVLKAPLSSIGGTFTAIAMGEVNTSTKVGSFTF